MEVIDKFLSAHSADLQVNPSEAFAEILSMFRRREFERIALLESRLSPELTTYEWQTLVHPGKKERERGSGDKKEMDEGVEGR